MNLNDILNALARQSRALEAQAEKLAAERDYSAEFPACDAEALRAARSMLCRIASGNPAGTPGAKVDASRLSPDLPPPHDSQEEAQRAAGIWPQEAEPATVRVKPSALDKMAAHAASWQDAFAERLAAPDPELVGQKMRGLEGRVAAASPALGAPYGEKCSYPKCTCPFDAPADPNWCARGLPKQKTDASAQRAEYLQKLGHYLDKLIELEGKAS